MRRLHRPTAGESRASRAHAPLVSSGPSICSESVWLILNSVWLRTLVIDSVWGVSYTKSIGPIKLAENSKGSKRASSWPTEEHHG